MKLKKVNLFLILATIFLGCPTYDPPGEWIIVHNYSNKPIYIYYSCSDSLLKFPGLLLFETITRNGKEQIIAPTYRIPAYEKKNAILVASKKNAFQSCENRKMNFFLISEDTMRSKTWDEIVDNQQFEKRKSLSKDELEALDWVVKF